MTAATLFCAIALAAGVDRILMMNSWEL